MRMLLNSFGRVQTHVDNSGYVVFDSSTAGSHSVNIGAGVYRVVLVGAGGGGAHCRYGAGHSYDGHSDWCEVIPHCSFDL